MFDRLFTQIDETRARAARDAGLPDAPAPTKRPEHPLVRRLGQLPLFWIALLLALALIGFEIGRIAWLTPFVLLPGIAIRIGSAAGLVPDRLVGGRTSREGALLGAVLWVVAALIAWVDPRLGGFASILLVALLARRLHRVALGGMYLVERERIRRGGVPSEALSGSGPALDGRSGAQEIAAMPTTEEEIR